LSGMLKTVKTKIRDVDVVGYIDQQTIGVLLPYTDKEGAEKFANKIIDKNVNQPFSIATATFPDQIFESLEKNGCVTQFVLKYMLDDAIDTTRQGLHLKRMIDVFGALTGLLLLSPFMLLVGLLVKMSSPGPIIFRQTRLGENGVPFTFYKFRSMRTDSNDQIHREFVKELINGNHAGINNSSTETPLYKMKADPRITKVGKFIRKTSIDELPQLFNVLKGDMSLVGPRPPLPYEAEKYQSWHLRRILDMKPGITGLWQVEGRSRTGFNEAVRLDLKYLTNWSNLLDIKILFKTVKEVVQCRGAV
ncbi:partial undecaprenyl-phosphate galactose phosphotransferase, partial [biofilm metagenome]